jgi:hypothetical protein
MIKFTKIITILLAFIGASSQTNLFLNAPKNNCVTFTVGQGTGCDWMCNYCANQLGTNNYYFQDGVCTYQTGGCVGNPISGHQYTCCATSEEEN